MKKKFLLHFLLCMIFLQSHAQETKKPVYRPFVVLELFTSEGCSSCPPAEKLLGKWIADAAKNNQAVYALEYHVDYWNKYGWKDPYSSFKYTLRQRNYISVLPESQAYTPQLMINGENAILGSDEKKASALLEKALNTPAPIRLDITYKGIVNDTLLIGYTCSKSDKNYFLKTALVDKEVTNAIGKGENAGKTLTHHNVVTAFHSFDLNQTLGTVKIPLNKKVPGKNQVLIAFIQQRQSMKILGVTALEFGMDVK